MEQEDIEALASMYLVGMLASGNTDPLAIPETVALAYDYADEFAAQTKRRNAKSFDQAHG